MGSKEPLGGDRETEGGESWGAEGRPGRPGSEGRPGRETEGKEKPPPCFGVTSSVAALTLAAAPW